MTDIDNRKRAREEHVAGDAADEVEKRPTKRSRRESATADRGGQEAVVVGANSGSAAEDGTRDNQCHGHVHQQSDETVGDVQGVGGTDLESENATSGDGDGDGDDDGPLQMDGCDDGNQPEAEAEGEIEVVFASGLSDAPKTIADNNYHDNHAETESNSIPIQNDAEKALEIAKMYEEAQRAEMVMTTPDEEDKEEEENTDANTNANANDNDEVSLKDARDLAIARAAAANIYHETHRGVSLVSDSQARLIDEVRGARARVRARAARKKKREEKRERARKAAEHDDDDDDEDSWDGFSESC